MGKFLITSAVRKHYVVIQVMDVGSLRHDFIHVIMHFETTDLFPTVT